MDKRRPVPLLLLPLSKSEQFPDTSLVGFRLIFPPEMNFGQVALHSSSKETSMTRPSSTSAANSFTIDPVFSFSITWSSTTRTSFATSPTFPALSTTSFVSFLPTVSSWPMATTRTSPPCRNLHGQAFCVSVSAPKTISVSSISRKGLMGSSSACSGVRPR